MFGNRFDKRRSGRSPMWAHGVGLVALVASMSVAACEGCRKAPSGSAPSSGTSAAVADAETPTLRFYLVSDFAGALEPCGCVKDQLGGVDHFAAFVHAEAKKAPNAALLASGPLFFMDPVLTPDHAAQDRAKARTIATALAPHGLVGFAPGVNDFAGGSSDLAALAKTSGGAVMFANGTASAVPLSKGFVRTIGGVKVGFVGVSEPDLTAAGGSVPGLDVGPPAPALETAVRAVKQDGAKVIVALAAVGRGQAKRLADATPDLTLILVGSSGGRGEANTTAPPPERIGNVLIAETSNHLQTVGVLDLFVRGDAFTFADGTGLELGQKRDELTRRIDDLHAKIAVWEKDGKVANGDLEARRADMKRLETERAALDAPRPPPSGSFFRYRVQEMRTSLGTDADVEKAMREYYKEVNEHNEVAFKDRLPPSHAPGEATYVGIDACTSCHEDARAVWDKTRHAKAYASLSSQFKEFNLDCVGCHVTGYERPGGSNVTHVEKLKDVQCEVCHGPGSKHAMNPDKVKPLVAKPKEDLCLGCHHPPHVEAFDAKAKMAEILGPGHGM